MDWLDIVWGWIVALGNALWATLVYLYQLILAGLQYTWAGLVQVARAVVSVGRYLWRGLGALRHLNFSKIWAAIKKGWDRFRRALAWYQSKILEPFDKLRRQILDIYRRYFRPLILTIDQFRSILRVVAIFDRRLAAALDRRLFQLERALMFPITEALRRINAHTSYLRALITASGYLDRVLILETLRRDALLVWEVLTNPLARIYGPPKPAARTGWTEMQRNWRQWVASETGPIADAVELRRQRFRDTLLLLE